MLLCDDLLKLRPTKDLLIERVRNKLALPSENHASHWSEKWSGKVDRYVFDQETMDQVVAVYENQQLRDIERIAKFPSNDFWLECSIGGYRYGWTPEVVNGELLLLCFQPFSNQNLVLPVGAIHWGSISGNAVTCSATRYGEAVDGFDFDRLSRGMLMGAFLLSVLASSRMVSVRRVVPSPADRVMLRRRAQLGRPFYSHNVVSLNLPDTSEMRGVLKGGEGCGTGKREHEVRGHWRLISLHVEAGELAPYWRWVDGHKAGDSALGIVVKTREVVIGNPSEIVRRGYQMPQGPGTPGVRVKARRAA